METIETIEQQIEQHQIMIDAQLDARDKMIVRHRATGWTLSQIGAKFGLSYERVRQICEKHGVKRGELLEAGD